MRLVLPLPSIFYATAYVAQSRGLFAQNGIEIELCFPPPREDPVNELLTGRADLAVGGPVRLMRFSKDKADQFSILGQVNSASGFYLVARDHLPRGDWEALKGRSIILFPGSRTPWLFTRELLMRNGVKPSDIKTIQIDSIELGVNLFLSRQADLIEASEPVVSMLEQEGKGQIWLSMPDLLGSMPFSVVIAQRAHLREQKDSISGFVKSLAASQEWLHSADIRRVAEELHKTFPEISVEMLTLASRRYREDGVWARMLHFSAQSLESLQGAILNGEEHLNRLDYDSIVCSQEQVGS